MVREVTARRSLTPTCASPFAQPWALHPISGFHCEYPDRFLLPFVGLYQYGITYIINSYPK